jgi:hypothetical protein
MAKPINKAMGGETKGVRHSISAAIKINSLVEILPFKKLKTLLDDDAVV